MALGVPVIARRNDGNSAIIQHRITGFLFDTPKVLYLYTFRACFLYLVPWASILEGLGLEAARGNATGG